MTISFFLIRLTPGGPEAALVSNPRVSAEALQRMRQRFGLDDPLPIQYVKWISSLIGWYPNGQGDGTPGDWLKHVILPSVLLGLGGLITFTRFVRSEVLEVLSQDYVRTARAKGLSELAVERRHVLRTALIPVVTLLGGLLPSLLSGAIITETIFNWPGMGRLFMEAASSRDYPLLLGMLLMGTVLTILGTLMADIGYGLVDPRVRYS